MHDFDIRSYGAEPNAEGEPLICQTEAIQRAIEAAHAASGGRVVVPPGLQFVTGSLELKSGVDLHLAQGSVLAGSRRREDYLEEQVAGEYGAGQSGFLVRADGAEHVAITGEGAIDQQGDSFADGFKTPEGPYALAWKSWRPRMLGLFGCRHVTIRGVTLSNTANWCVHLLGCDDVDIEKVTIRTPLDGPNCDGICPDHCTRVRIHDCDISSGDDSIVIKTTREGLDRGYDGCHDIEVSDCQLMSTSAAIKIGSESQSDLSNLRFSNCKIRSSARGLGIQLRDGGSVRGAVFSGIDIETRLFHDQWWGKAEPIYVTVVPREPGRRVGRVEGVRFEHIRARSEGGVMIAASELGHIDGVELRDVRLRIDKWTKWPGGFHDWRPMLGGEQTGLRPHPTSAVYIQRARRLLLEDLSVEWGERLPDYYRHAVLVDRHTDLVSAGFEGQSADPGSWPAWSVAPV